VQTSAFVLVLNFCTLAELKCFDYPAFANTPNVVVKFFFATEQILICHLFVSIAIRVGQTFPEFFLFQKSKKKSANNRGFCASVAGRKYNHRLCKSRLQSGLDKQL
jgi:hypothetical protein